MVKKTDREFFLWPYHKGGGQSMKKQRFSRSELIHAYTYSNNTRDDLIRCTVCGCYHCLSIFLANEVQFQKDGNQSDEEGRCPICGSRKILGESSAYPLNYDFLSAMHKLTF